MKDKKADINLEFPTKKYKKYLKIYGESKSELLTVDQLKSFFVLIVSDFKKGYLSMDELSIISSNLLWKGLSLKKDGPKHQNFWDVLDAAAELSFYSRGADKKNIGNIFLDFLTQVLSYKDSSK